MRPEILNPLFVPVSNPRDYLIGALVLIWATRLGQFLFRRVLSAGEDRRFREMKTDFLQFFMTWTLQGLWVAVARIIREELDPAFLGHPATEVLS